MKRASTNWFPFYLYDFRQATISMSTEHKGAYLELLCELYQHKKPLPYDEKLIAKITGLTPYKMKRFMPVFRDYFTITGNYFTQDRVELVLAEQAARDKKRTQKAVRAAATRWGVEVDQQAVGQI